MTGHRAEAERVVRRKMRAYPLFFQAVWRAVMRIPPGQTRSYAWVARRIGRPRAWRAVAQALARNPFAPIVPCHRVVRADGSLGGYSGPGGTAAKRRLLAQERRGAPGARRRVDFAR